MVEKEKGKTYSSAEDYQVLEDIEHVRKRPGNYIGSTDENGWHHLFQEIIDNSIDEAVAGNCDKIRVLLSDNQKTITVEDNGFGIPMDIHPKTNQSILVTLFSFLKSGGKFSDKIYKTSGGLHGLGVTIVNALSKNLKAINRRKGKTQIVEFSQGILMSEEILETPDLPNGLSVTFTPDPVIFLEFSYFKVETISKRLKELAYLNPELTIFFHYSSREDPLIYHFEKGLVGLIEELSNANFLPETEAFVGEWDRSEPYFHLIFSWKYLEITSNNYLNKSFCNNINTSGGGTHVEGFESGFVLAVKDWVKNKYPQLKFSIIRDDILTGLIVAIAIRIKEPQFSGQTKSFLSDKYVREIVKTAVFDLTKKFFQDNVNSAEKVIGRILTVAQNRTKTEEFQTSLRDSSRGFILPGKLSPCISKIPEETSLFLVEGDSAEGSAKLARNPRYQAILPLKGKILNIEKSENEKVFANEEIKNVVNAFGLSVGEAATNFYNRFRDYLDDPSWESLPGLSEDFIYIDSVGEEKIISANTELQREHVQFLVLQSKKDLLKKIRYGKVFLMADADPDGNHIKCLELTFLFSFFRYLFEDGRIFLAAPPLYRWKTKKTSQYFYDDKELNFFKENNVLSGGILQRFKGLGEMNAIDLRETTMDPETGRFYQVLISDVFQIKKNVDELMGSKSESRRKYLESGLYRDAPLVITDNQIELDHALLVKFLNYAHEVVEDRALPGMDGLKPVQRRILYTCYQLNLSPESAHRKSSKIVGDVVGDYHPHGNESIYLAMVKMAQDFYCRYPLIDGQGNWGSIDGDSPASMRYTEARLTKYGVSLLSDLPFETENWKENYDGTKKEPTVLSPNLNLLLNGSSGIAVGMNTNIPPHNLSEIAEAVILLAKQPNLSLEGLIEQVPIAPDFPTGGEILERENLKEIYKAGEGTIHIRAKTKIVTGLNSKRLDTILVYEIPYKVPKSKLIENVGDLIKSKKIEGLRNVEDYSNLEQPVNIHLQFDPNYDPNVILNQLYKLTTLQTTFPVKIRALINSRPRLFPLLDILQNYIDSRLNHIKKKAKFIFEKNEKELESLLTRKFIIENNQKIYLIISRSVSEEEIKSSLAEEFSLKEKEINRILDTPSTFRQFSPEKRKRLDENIKTLEEKNIQQKLLIDNKENRIEYLIKELLELKEQYKNDLRRTVLSSQNASVLERDLIPFEERFVIFSKLKAKEKINNYLTINSLSYMEGTNIPSQGKELKFRGEVWHIRKANRRDEVWCFTNFGRLFIVKLYKIYGVNKTINLNEEFFVREKEKKMMSFLFPEEKFILVLPVSESIEPNSLLYLLSSEGYIKTFPVQRLVANMGSSGKRLFNLSKKPIIRCSKHQQQLNLHKENSHVCGITCSEAREIQKIVLACPDCQKEEIPLPLSFGLVSAVIAKEGDTIEVVVKRRKTSNILKSQRVLVKKKIRNKTEISFADFVLDIPEYCSEHQEENKKHWLNHIEKKENCSVSCKETRNIRSLINNCFSCQNDKLFSQRPKKKIKGEKFVNFLVHNNEDNEDSNIFLLFKKDGTMEKKDFSIKPGFIGNDARLKKTNNCKKHWIEINESKILRERIERDLEEENISLQNRLLNLTIPLEEKEKLAKKAFETLGRELIKKISVSPIDHLIGEKVVEEQKSNFIQASIALRKLKKTHQHSLERFETLKEKVKKCLDCQKHCPVHEISKLEHQKSTCFFCKEKLEQINKELNTSIKSLENSLKLEPSNENLKQELLKKRQKKKQLIANSFFVLASCPTIKASINEKKNCLDCQKQNKKKHTAIISNPLVSLVLVKKKEVLSPEIIILTNDGSSCLYNKKDLEQFVEQNKSYSKSLLKDKNRSITSVVFSRK